MSNNSNLNHNLSTIGPRRKISTDRVPLAVVGALPEHRRVDGIPFRNFHRHFLALNGNPDELLSGADDVKQGPVPLRPESCGNCSGSQISGFARPHDDRRVDAVERGVGDALVAVDQ